MAFSYSSGLDLRGAEMFAADIELPQLVLKKTAMEHNLDVMAEFCADSGVSIAPHVKTSMSPYVIRRQLEAGAWAITVASMQQLRTCLDIGAPRILLANELISPTAARWLGERLVNARVEVYCLVDSLEGAARLAHGWNDAGRLQELPVLVELGIPGGRTGCRSVDQLCAVARVISEQRGLRLVGVEGFEGILGSDRTTEVLERVDTFLYALVAGARRLLSEGLLDASEILLSAGGSLFVDRAADILARASLGVPTRVVLRSGCYVTHDHARPRGGTPFPSVSGGPALVPALELWSEVLSRPEPTRAIAGFGRRHAPYDSGLPVPLARLSTGGSSLEPLKGGVTVTQLNDQHAYLQLDSAETLDVGDRLVCGIVHPCSAFDRWREILLVNDAYRIEETIQTRFS